MKYSRVQNCKILAVSEAAIKVRLPSGREAWIPASILHDDSDLHRGAEVGTEGALICQSWKIEEIRNARPAVDMPPRGERGSPQQTIEARRRREQKRITRNQWR